MPAEPVSVVVCAYTDERRALLWQNLAALERQTLAPEQVVVVVDNNPALAAAVAADWPHVDVVRHAGPRGLSGARNAGVAASEGRLLVFLDDDAVPDADCLELLTAPLCDPAIAGVGGRAVAVWPNGRRPRWLPAEFDWVVGCSYVGQPQRRAQVRNVLGSVMALRRDVVVRTGGFRTGVGRVGDDGAGCEETEMCIRYAALDPGARFLLEPAAVVRHHVGAGRVSMRYFWRRCRAEGRSKALLTATLGAGPALAAERDYVRRALPRGVARGVTDVARGDVAGLARALNIAVGLIATASAYATAPRRSRAVAQDQPALVTAA